jgi:hypothetical protein
MSSTRKFLKEELRCLSMLYDTISESFEALETLAKRIWKERIRRALFFATREEMKKFGLEGGLLCLYECVFLVCCSS